MTRIVPHGILAAGTLGFVMLMGIVEVVGGQSASQASENTAAVSSETARPGIARIGDDRLLAAVVPLAPGSYDASRRDARTQQSLQTCYDSVLDWGKVLGRSFHVVPGHPEWGYYGDGGHRENSFRPICYAAMTNAFLAKIDPATDGADRETRDRMQREAIASLRYLVYSHQANGGTCLDGKPWGNQWQSAMWARSVGMAAWLLWDDLDRPTQLAVARVIEFEADRFLAQKPKSSLKNDTGAEENAWNAGLITLARCMMPGHPRAQAWDQAAKRYLYNTFSVEADKDDESIGDDGRRVCDWVSTVNAHPDYLVENHGLVHVGYLKNSHAMLLEGALPYIMTGREVPKACLHHADGVLEILLGCIAWEGAPIYFGGNDWKLVHTQCTDVINFALTDVLLGDARAARIAENGLASLRRIQKQYQGYYTVRHDLEHNGLAASRLIGCYLALARMRPGADPMGEQELDKSLTGVRLLKYGQAILQRTPSKFVSFAWGNKRMALAMPRDGNWVVWPHYASYLGLIDGRDGSSQSKARLTALQHGVEPNRFAVTGTLQRLQGKITQDFAFASLEKDVVVYVERLRAAPGFQPQSRETGVVGHEYPLESNRRTLHGQFGQKEVVGVGNEKCVHLLKSDWLNLGGKVGYVVRRGEGRQNVIRYHDETRTVWRVPKLQEWFSLIGDETLPPVSAAGDWACVVTFLNQSPEQTEHWAGRVRFDVDGDRATCRIGDDTVRIDFANQETRIDESSR